MRRVLLAAVAGLAAGAIASFVAVERGWLPVRPTPRIIGAVPRMSLAEAETHRNNRYESLRSIAEVLALPGDFAQTEALYALAGRSDSAALQHLIFQASGITDASDRDAALGILFARLAELDPASALALTETAEFAGDQSVANTVWRSWAKLDLDAALAAAASLDSASRRNLAAQAMFAAYDYWGNDETQRIAEALGIEPDRRTRSAYLVRLAEADPVAAIDYVNGMDSVADRGEAAATLGNYFGRDDAERATEFAALFNDAGLRRYYSSAVARAAAQVDPVATLETLLRAGDTGLKETPELLGAFEELSARDIDQALAYFERIDNPQRFQSISAAIAEALVPEDPARAIAWAKENDRGVHSPLLGQVLFQLAMTQPELAIAEAQALRNPIARQNALDVIASANPQKAVELLDYIPPGGDRRTFVQSIARSWMWHEPDAAMSWILTLPDSERDESLSMAVQFLSQSDLNAAIRYLPQIDERHAPAWRVQIAQGLAMQRSVGEAGSFIAQFEGTDEYPELLSAVVSGLAQSDIGEAMRMAERMPAGIEKDSMYSMLVMRYAEVDPRQAVASLALINDESQRADATMQVASQWSQSEPEAAQQWAGSLPSGQQRDAAIMAIASQWEEITLARQQLIDSIGDVEVRKQVVISVIYRVASSDPERAERMLQEIDLSEQEKEQVREMTRSIREQVEQPYLLFR